MSDRRTLQDIIAEHTADPAIDKSVLEKKNSFLLYHDDVENLLNNDFSNEEIGLMFKAISMYAMYGECVDSEFFSSDRACICTYNNFISALKRSYDSYVKSCKKKSEAAKKQHQKDV